MLEETKKKLKVLKQAHQIDQADLDFINNLDKKISIFDESNKEEMLLIHVAMALSRAREKTPIDPMPEELWQQIKQKEAYENAINYWREISLKVPVQLNKSEKQFIIMHLVNVMSERSE